MAYTTEDEQIEAIRRWWSENGRSVIAGVIIAIAGVVGWQQWQAWQERSALAASTQYQALNSRIAAGKTDAVVQSIESLQTQASGSPYAALGSLSGARYLVEQGEYGAAADQLRWVREHSATEALRQVARLRLGQVLQADGQHDAALEALAPVPEGAFAARFQEVKGDVLVAAGRRDEAIPAYQTALEAGLTGQRRRYVEIKLSDLGAGAGGAS